MLDHREMEETCRFRKSGLVASCLILSRILRVIAPNRCLQMVNNLHGSLGCCDHHSCPYERHNASFLACGSIFTLLVSDSEQNLPHQLSPLLSRLGK
ncbi:Uncharacterized protein HZ326_28293 [Fusarium oxysporum f. sp. albedinis]|nr:Uncharacterized protein HZ326_28293 [Fusarium oxysporum f. sp. albedinis]